MDTWLKATVVGTCAFVVCGVLYFVIKDWRGGPSETDLVLERHDQIMRAVREHNNR